MHDDTTKSGRKLDDGHGEEELLRSGSKNSQTRAKRAEGIGPGLSGDQYARIVENPFIKAEGGDGGFDVFDRRRHGLLRQRAAVPDADEQLPPPDAVRIEELVNYFDYDYAGRRHAGRRSAVRRPRRSGRLPLERRASARARSASRAARWTATSGRKSNLVFLVDVSGSMDEPNKLPLVVYGLRAAHPRAGRERPRGDRRLRQQRRPRAAQHAAATSSRTILAALGQLAGRRLDGRRRRHPARLPDRRGQFHQGRHEPRHPLHRRRLQRRRHQHGRAAAAGRDRRPRTPACSSPCSASAAATSTTR